MKVIDACGMCRNDVYVCVGEGTGYWVLSKLLRLLKSETEALKQKGGGGTYRKQEQLWQRAKTSRSCWKRMTVGVSCATSRFMSELVEGGYEFVMHGNAQKKIVGKGFAANFTKDDIGKVRVPRKPNPGWTTLSTKYVSRSR
jgi:hypothetical protein